MTRGQLQASQRIIRELIKVKSFLQTTISDWMQLNSFSWPGGVAGISLSCISDVSIAERYKISELSEGKTRLEAHDRAAQCKSSSILCIAGSSRQNLSKNRVKLLHLDS